MSTEEIGRLVLAELQLMTAVECGVCHRMVPADTVSWCFTSDDEGEYAVCPSCESGPLLNSPAIDS